MPIDFYAWRGDASALRDCLNAHRAGHCPAVSKYSLAYLLNAAAVAQLGPRVSAEVAQALLNLGALLLPLAALALLRRDRRDALRAGAVYAAAVALSPLSAFYVRSGALEIQAGVACGLFLSTVALWWGRREVRSRAALWALMAAASLAFPLFKDTLAALVLLGCGAAALICGRRWSGPDWRAWRTDRGLWVMAGLVLTALALCAGYNLVRYGVPWPAAYLAEAAATSPSWGRSAGSLLGSIFSPNGGVLVFWALPGFILTAGLAFLGGRFDRPAVAAALGCVAVSLLAYSRWWATFGWDSWGDRLMVQPMLSLLVVAVLTSSFAPAEEAAPRAWRFWLPALPTLLTSAMYFAIPYVAGGTGVMQPSLFAEPECQEMVRHVHEGGDAFWRSERYYRCATARMLHVPSP
jgi:hypothetical protein